MLKIPLIKVCFKYIKIVFTRSRQALWGVCQCLPHPRLSPHEVLHQCVWGAGDPVPRRGQRAGGGGLSDDGGELQLGARPRQNRPSDPEVRSYNHVMSECYDSISLTIMFYLWISLKIDIIMWNSCEIHVKSIREFHMKFIWNEFHVKFTCGEFACVQLLNYLTVLCYRYVDGVLTLTYKGGEKCHHNQFQRETIISFHCNHSAGINIADQIWYQWMIY